MSIFYARQNERHSGEAAAPDIRDHPTTTVTMAWHHLTYRTVASLMRVSGDDTTRSYIWFCVDGYTTKITVRLELNLDTFELEKMLKELILVCSELNPQKLESAESTNLKNKPN